MSKKESYHWLIKQSRIVRFWLNTSVILGIVNGLLVIAQAAILATVIDRVYLHQASLAQLSHLLILLLVIIFLKAACIWCREISGFNTADLVKKEIRTNLYNNLLEEQPDNLAKRKAGALTTTLIEKIEALHNFYCDYLPQMTIVVLLPLIILALVFSYNWIAGLILLITGPLIPLFMALVGMGVEVINQRHFKSLSRLSAGFLDILQGLTTLTYFNKARTQIKSIQTMSESYRIKTMQVLRVAFLSSAVLELFSTVAIAMIAVYLGLGLLGLVHIGIPETGISLQKAFFILLLAPEFFMPLRQLGTFYHARAEAIAAADELFKLDEKNKASITHRPQEIAPSIIKSLQFSNVCFEYNDNKPIINHLNIKLIFGECVAITGPSGVGKSTFLKLIAKLQTPTTGSIFINEMDLSNIDTESWRTNIAWLMQNPYLFHDSISANIGLAKSNAKKAEILQAALAADVQSFTQSLPNGIETLIGEKHLGLSGGQAQRVALARAYLKDAPIILLDEPTAHLDQDNKTIILQALSAWKKKKLIVIATHDKDILALADKVIDFPSIPKSNNSIG